MNQELIALYELKRQAFLLGYIQHPDRFDDALAFACLHRLAPIFHENNVRETYGGDPFDEVYAVKRKFMEEVLQYVHEKWNAKDLSAIGFYDLEDKFEGCKADRGDMIALLEYARIAGKFDDEVWRAVEKNAPVEAKNLADAFSPQEIRFE